MNLMFDSSVRTALKVENTLKNDFDRGCVCPHAGIILNFIETLVESKIYLERCARWTISQSRALKMHCFASKSGERYGTLCGGLDNRRGGSCLSSR